MTSHLQMIITVLPIKGPFFTDIGAYLEHLPLSLSSPTPISGEIVFVAARRASWRTAIIITRVRKLHFKGSTFRIVRKSVIQLKTQCMDLITRIYAYKNKVKKDTAEQMRGTPAVGGFGSRRKKWGEEIKSRVHTKGALNEEINGCSEIRGVFLSHTG
ncbi:hypothetical protein CEXT_202161 [Caerostris extrusa]|uniref:Uncharacterized protein n=1 Tax=Caerostris extrusa TaxID=172846 RepID=A0AAV4T420_CAEEX|nr:hypothetical protein CEXT_202161 [Caerostris extrusa]